MAVTRFASPWQLVRPPTLNPNPVYMAHWGWCLFNCLICVCLCVMGWSDEDGRDGLSRCGNGSISTTLGACLEHRQVRHGHSDVNLWLAKKPGWERVCQLFHCYV